MPLTFEEADKLYNSSLCLLASRDTRCRLAALRQQALNSDAPDSCPKPTDSVVRNVWISWKTLRGLPQSEAVIRFTFAVERVCVSLLEDAGRLQNQPAEGNLWDSWDTRRKSRGMNASAALWGGLPGMIPRKSFKQSVLALAIVVLVSCSDQSCRFVLDVATPPYVKPAYYGWLAGPLFTLVNSVSGVLITSFGDKNGSANRVFRVAVGLTMWSLATFATGLSRTIFSVVILRIISAIAMASCNPYCTSIIADLFVEERRGLALGVYALGVYLGYGLALGPYSVITYTFGWRFAYCLAGIFGIIILLALILLVDEPIRGACDTFFHNSYDPKSGTFCQYCIGGEEGFHAVKGLLKPGTAVVFTTDAVVVPRNSDTNTKSSTATQTKEEKKKLTILDRFLSGNNLASMTGVIRVESEENSLSDGGFSPIEAKASMLQSKSASGKGTVSSNIHSGSHTHFTAGSNTTRKNEFQNSFFNSQVYGGSAEDLRVLLLKEFDGSAKSKQKLVDKGKVPLGTKGTLLKIHPHGDADVKLKGLSRIVRTQLRLLKRPLPTSEVASSPSIGEAMYSYFTSPGLMILGLTGGVLNAVGLVLANYIHTRNGGYFGVNGVRKCSEFEILFEFSWMPLVGGCIGSFVGGALADVASTEAGRLRVLAMALMISLPLAFSTLLLPVPWAFLGFLFQQISGEMWPGIIMASVVDLSTPKTRSRIIALHYLLTANIGGFGVLAVSYLTTESYLSLQEAMMIFYPGMLGLGLVLVLITAQIVEYESMDCDDIAFDPSMENLPTVCLFWTI